MLASLRLKGSLTESRFSEVQDSADRLTIFLPLDCQDQHRYAISIGVVDENNDSTELCRKEACGGRRLD